MCSGILNVQQNGSSRYPFFFRKRTALHLAVGIKDINMVRALMRWRRELNNSLEDKQYALDQRRDLFVQRCTLASTVGRRESVRVFSLSDVEQFEEWLFEERQRLVRETELRCEEYWRKAVTARDDKGRTPLHWAASGTGGRGLVGAFAAPARFF